MHTSEWRTQCRGACFYWESWFAWWIHDSGSVCWSWGPQRCVRGSSSQAPVYALLSILVEGKLCLWCLELSEFAIYWFVHISYYQNSQRGNLIYLPCTKNLILLLVCPWSIVQFLVYRDWQKFHFRVSCKDDVSLVKYELINGWLFETNGEYVVRQVLVTHLPILIMSVKIFIICNTCVSPFHVVVSINLVSFIYMSCTIGSFGKASTKSTCLVLNKFMTGKLTKVRWKYTWLPEIRFQCSFFHIIVGHRGSLASLSACIHSGYWCPSCASCSTLIPVLVHLQGRLPWV